jgi:two-component system response regulator AtoC
VLVVDDDDGLRRRLAASLSAAGFDVAVATDGEQAISALAARPFDALLLDLQMRPSDGWYVISYLQHASRRPLTILMSAHVDVPLTVQALRAGVFDVLQKPVDFADVLRRLQDKGLGRDETGAHSTPGAPARRAAEVEERAAGAPTRPAPPAVLSPEPPGSGKPWGLGRILGDDPSVRRVREQIASVARFGEVSVLVIGETGTGKELVAEAIHDVSAARGPFVSLNCAAVPESLFESELFGHEAGAFTGARTAKVGLFEAARGGTLFLDEVGELRHDLQPKLLRVLETRQFRRVGGQRDIPLQARIVSATNRRLGANAGTQFRTDLYFRLAGFTIVTPPLRERLGDIDVLTSAFLRNFASRYSGVPERIETAALDFLRQYAWPGNVRELRAVVEQAGVFAQSTWVTRADVELALRQRLQHDTEPQESVAFIPGTSGTFRTAGTQSLPDLQRRLIVDAFQDNAGNLARTARQLGIPRTTLRDHLKRYGML